MRKSHFSNGRKSDLNLNPLFFFSQSCFAISQHQLIAVRRC